jgi:hypothetical protein
MRIIKYKPADSLEFKNYIDIGSCERDYYCINFYLPGDNENSSGKRYFDSYNSWFENFKLESIGSKMIILQYYLSEYMGWSNDENSPQPDYFADVYGEETTSVMSNNLDYFLHFNNKWFKDEYVLFNGLDLTWDDIEETFVSSKADDDGITTEIEFDDGSVLRFLDRDDSIHSFYVPEEDFPGLKNEIYLIESKFQL